MADVEEEVRRALVVAVLEQLGERELEQVLVEARSSPRRRSRAERGGGHRAPTRRPLARLLQMPGPQGRPLLAAIYCGSVSGHGMSSSDRGPMVETMGLEPTTPCLQRTMAVVHYLGSRANPQVRPFRWTGRYRRRPRLPVAWGTCGARDAGELARIGHFVLTTTVNTAASTAALVDNRRNSRCWRCAPLPQRDGAWPAGRGHVTSPSTWLNSMTGAADAASYT